MFNRIKQLFSAQAAAPQHNGTSNASDADNAVLYNAYCTVAALPALDFPHVLAGQRDLSDAALAPHLNGFMHYVADGGNGQMTRVRYHVIRHLQRVQQHVSLSVAPAALAQFQAWAQAANAIVFLEDGSVRDPQGRVLLAARTGDGAEGAEGANGGAGDNSAAGGNGGGKPGGAAAGAAEGDPAAVIPYPPAAWARKARSDAALAERRIVVPADLPPVVSEAELRLRAPEEILQRMLALYIVAIRAESLLGDHAIAVEDLRKRFAPAFAGLSDAERAYLADAAPTEHASTQFLWRYEAILVLQWALGLQPELPFADSICDVAALSSKVIDQGTQGLRKQPVVRPAAELLDALDFHYRLHWATRQAGLKKTAAPAGLNDGVLQERHHALNWLVRFEERDWDDVDTPT